MKTVFWFSI